MWFGERRTTAIGATVTALMLSGALLSGAPAAGAQSGAPLSAPSTAPSRASDKGCAWERVADKTAGFTAWVERCDYGKRKIQLYIKGNALLQQYSDGGATPDTLIESFPLLPDEVEAVAVRRVYLAHTARAISDRCVIAPYTEGKAPAGMKRFTFVPNAAYDKALKAKQDPNEVPEPPCGDWGIAPDGQQYFAAWPAAGVRRVLFVRVGQDTPLFDAMTLQLLPPPAPAKPKSP